MKKHEEIVSMKKLSRSPSNHLATIRQQLQQCDLSFTIHITANTYVWYNTTTIKKNFFCFEREKEQRNEKRQTDVPMWENLFKMIVRYALHSI